LLNIDKRPAGKDDDEEKSFTVFISTSSSFDIVFNIIYRHCLMSKRRKNEKIVIGRFDFNQ
jgi:hypothetical protein